MRPCELEKRSTNNNKTSDGRIDKLINIPESNNEVKHRIKKYICPYDPPTFVTWANMVKDNKREIRKRTKNTLNHF